MNANELLQKLDSLTREVRELKRMVQHGSDGREWIDPATAKKLCGFAGRNNASLLKWAKRGVIGRTPMGNAYWYKRKDCIRFAERRAKWERENYLK